MSRRNREENGFVVWLTGLSGAGKSTIADALAADLRASGACGGRVEVHVAPPLDECIRRDTKGLYKKALAGEIPQFTGISDPYEPPDAAEVTLDTSTIDLRASVQRVTAKLVELGYLDEAQRSVQDSL